MRHIEKAAAIRPKFEMPFINLGSIAKQKKQDDKALYYFKDILGKNSYNGMAYFQIGDILYRQAKYEKAARYFMKGIHVVPNSAVLYIEMGQSLMKLGRLEDARACFRKAIALDPAYLPVTENLSAVTTDGRLKGDTARDRTERGR